MGGVCGSDGTRRTPALKLVFLACFGDNHTHL